MKFKEKFEIQKQMKHAVVSLVETHHTAKTPKFISLYVFPLFSPHSSLSRFETKHENYRRSEFN